MAMVILPLYNCIMKIFVENFLKSEKKKNCVGWRKFLGLAQQQRVILPPPPP